MHALPELRPLPLAAADRVELAERHRDGEALFEPWSLGLRKPEAETETLIEPLPVAQPLPVADAVEVAVPEALAVTVEVGEVVAVSV